MKAYVGHSQFHFSEYRPFFKCPLKGCRRQLLSYGGLKSHLFRDHQSHHTSNVESLKGLNVKLICNVSVCQEVFQSIQGLMKHLRNHIRDGTLVHCPISQCPAKSRFNKVSSFSSHISRHHINYLVKDLSTVVLSTSESDKNTYENNSTLSLPSTSRAVIPGPSMAYSESGSNFFFDHCGNTTVGENETGSEAGDTEEKLSELYLINVAKFYLKLQVITDYYNNCTAPIFTAKCH